MLRRFFPFSISLFGALLSVSLLAAGTAWASGQETIDPMNWTVFFLMAAPYVVVGSIVGWLLYSHRRKNKRRDQKEEVRPALGLMEKESER